jgi:hypothetical protein
MADDMSTTDEHAQPMPIPSDRPSIQSLVRADIDAREQVGISRYGTSLQPHNGRDMLRDAYDEAMDLTTYLRGVIEERDNPAPVADAELRDRIANVAWDVLESRQRNRDVRAVHTSSDMVNLAGALLNEVVIPVLAGRDAEIDRLRVELLPLLDLPRQLKNLRGLTRALVAELGERADVWDNEFGTGEGAPGPQFRAAVDKHIPGLRQLIERQMAQPPGGES